MGGLRLTEVFVGKASRLKRERKEGELSAQEAMRAKFKAPDGVPTSTEADGPKLSDALEEIFNPYLEKGMGLKERKNLARLAALAWNAMLMPDSTVRSTLERTFSELPGQTRAAAIQMITDMAQRRRQRFPEDRRWIADTDVHALPDGSFYLVVAHAKGHSPPPAG